MDYQFTESDNNFRTEVVDFIDNNWVPASASDDNPDAGFEAERAFEKRAASKGWLTMAWPEEYGGRGASHIQQMIYREEAAYRGAPGSGGQGISMVGPCLMLHGTEEPSARNTCRRIANAESYWAQGFSEPGNGSDLAGLQTRAVRDGDDFVINGQKIWTSGAQHADWIHVLTRTDTEAPKHRGISYFLLDMNTPGIEVQTADQHARRAQLQRGLLHRRARALPRT